MLLENNKTVIKIIILPLKTTDYIILTGNSMTSQTTVTVSFDITLLWSKTKLREECIKTFTIGKLIKDWLIVSIQDKSCRYNAGSNTCNYVYHE